MDTEFSGLHQFTNIISIGIISECGKTFYAEFNDYDQMQIDEWIKTHVIDNLYLTPFDNCASYDEFRILGNKKDVADALSVWLKQFDKVQIWSDCLAYDWVLFCQIFGHAFNIPKNVHYIPFDLATLFEIKGFDSDTNREIYSQMQEDSKKHNSLWDAKVIKECYNKLIVL